MTETVPTYEDYPSLKPLRRMVTDYLAVQHAIHELETTKRNLTDAMMPLMNKARVKAVLVGDDPVRVIESTQKRLSKDRLMELGVESETIRLATIEVPSRAYLSVGKKAEENRKKHSKEEV